MKKICVIQGSLSKDSKTRIVIDKVIESLESKEVQVELIDLRDLELQFCDGRDIEQYNDDMQKAYRTMLASDAFVIGMPVYCYSFSGVLKNFLDITCDAMAEKPFGIVCNSGGPRSYLASADLVKMLTFEVNCLPVFPTIHTSSGDFENGEIKNAKIFEKIENMTDNLLKL